MGNVIEFKRLEIPSKEAHAYMSGAAICMCCQHEFAAVAPAGVVVFECPNCGTHKATWKYECSPETFWQCNCGNQLFYLTPEGSFCPNCGSYGRD